MRRAEQVQITLQAVLCHLWRCRDAGTPEVAEVFPKGFLIAYKGLIEFGPLTGLYPIQMGRVLSGVATFCAENGWPPLHALVVNAERGRPGRGFFVSPTNARDPAGWKVEDFRRCVESMELPRVAPVVWLEAETRESGVLETKPRRATTVRQRRGSASERG